MTIRCLDPKEGKGIKDAINNDAEFRLDAKFFTNDVLFEFGEEKAIVEAVEKVLKA